MILWVLQMLLNLVLSYFAFLWLVSKKRIAWLEAQLEILNQTVIHLNSQKNGTIPKDSEPSEVAVDRGQLIEKFLQSSDPRKSFRPSPEAYDRADQLLSRGTDLKEVAKQTGLSVAELQLMGKVASRMH
jgi:hypothetical protein